MQMPHRLSAFLAAVGDHPEALVELFLPVNLINDLIDVSDDCTVLRGDGRSGGNVLLRNHHRMKGRLGIDVPKGENPVILIDLGARDFAAGDATKQAIHEPSSF